MSENIESRVTELQDVENQLMRIMSDDKQKWVSVYQLMDQVEKEKLYEEEGYHSMTAWCNDLAKRAGFQVRELYRAKKAGRFYAAYKVRCEKRGVVAPDLSSGDIAISPRTLELVDKIAAGDDDEGDRLMEKVLSGEVSSPQLRQVWKSKRWDYRREGKIRKNAYDNLPSAIETFEDVDVNANDIILALQTHKKWMPGMIEKFKFRGFRESYRLLSEFAIHTGSADRARRVDAMIFETSSVMSADEVMIHAVEIKVAKSDLLNDTKMQEYADFSDYSWICVPNTEEMVDAAEEYLDDGGNVMSLWGILVVDSNGDVRVIKNAVLSPGVMRDLAITHALYELL